METPTKPTKPTIGAQVEERVKAEVDAKAKILHISPSKLIRVAVEHFLAQDLGVERVMVDRYDTNEELAAAEAELETAQERVARHKRELIALVDELERLQKSAEARGDTEGAERINRRMEAMIEQREKPADT